MLPTLLTLGNVYFGFVAVYCCALQMREVGAGRTAAAQQTLQSAFLEAHAPSYLAIAAWLVALAMLCDSLDGWIARKTGQSTRFGEQLDTLGDLVSFGLAPALMMVTLIQRELTRWPSPPLGFDRFGQAAMLIGTLYVCCAALRLARFTVEASVEESAHTGFRGIPSPGAAGGVITLVYLHDCLRAAGGWETLTAVVAKLLPVATLIIALLMVSRIPYRHAASSFLKQRPFSHVVMVVLLLPLLLLYTAQMFAVIAWAFIASGMVRWARLKSSGDGDEEGESRDEGSDAADEGVSRKA